MLWAVYCQIGIAQNDTTKIKSIDDYYLDFAVPDLSAFTLLGINPNSISRPGNTKELAANILNVVSGGKNISPGLAIEWSPYKTFERKDNRTFDSYKRGAFLRNSQISFGSVQDSLGSKISLGYKWVFIDKSDILMDDKFRRSVETLLRRYNQTSISADSRNNFLIQLRNTLKNIDPQIFSGIIVDGQIIDLFNFETPPNYSYILTQIIEYFNGKSRPLTEDEKRSIENHISIFFSLIQSDKIEKEKILKEVDELKESFKKESWNKSVAQLGFGSILNSPDQTWKGLKNDRLSGFIGYSVPLTKVGQAIFQVQYTNYYGDSVKYKTLFTAGTRLLFGNSDVRGSLEGQYVKNQKGVAKEDEEKIRVTAGFEIKMSNGLWLELAVGINGSTSEFKDSSLVSLANVKYAFNKERRFLK